MTYVTSYRDLQNEFYILIEEIWREFVLADKEKLNLAEINFGGLEKNLNLVGRNFGGF